MVASRERIALWELDRIEAALSENGDQTLIVMKGCAYLLLGISNLSGRVFADVDLMTSERELSDVESRLNCRGWRTTKLSEYDQKYYRKWTHELPPLIHEEREVEVDIHHNILPRTARLKPPAEKLLARARRIEGSTYLALSDEDIVLHAMVHLMFDSDLADKLRDLVDIKDLLDQFAVPEPAFWDRLLERAEELNLERPAYYSLRYANRLINLAIPDSVLESTRKWAPVRPLLLAMDRLVPVALFPPHPDRRQRFVGLARLLLYVRSHWIRMPPWLLIYHLSYKFVIARMLRRSHG